MRMTHLLTHLHTTHTQSKKIANTHRRIHELVDSCVSGLTEIKTAAVYFSNKLSYPNSITIYNIVILWSNDAKNLGVILDQRQTAFSKIAYSNKQHNSKHQGECR